NTHSIPYYLDCGTLLGTIRENDLLPHDTDVDVTTHLSDWDRLKEIDFTKYGLKKTRQWDKNHKLISVKFQDKRMHVDIYCNPAFPKLETRILNNVTYKIPIESELYLEQLYNNWRVKSSQHADWPRLFYGRLITGPYAKNWDPNYKIIRL
nr:LicD family protein [Paracoccaceae bacterium]